MKYKVEWLNNLLKNINKSTDTALMKCWLYLESRLKEQMRKDSYDTWELASSITTRMIQPWLVEVWTNLEYAVIREYWRRPWKFPPLDVIAKWTARKGMITWWVNTWYDNLYYKDKWVVFVIARAIATRGIEWKHTFEKVYEREKDNIIDLFNKYFNQW